MIGKLLAVATVALCATMSMAEEFRLELNSVYPLNQEMITLRDRAFLFQDNRGSYEVVEGPLADGSVRCMGSGFGFEDGTNTIAGICIFSQGKDSFTMHWKAGERGAANTWDILDGTGHFEGMTGSGIASTDRVSMFQALQLRQTHIVGTVDIP
jgi:hypothetical protein